MKPLGLIVLLVATGLISIPVMAALKPYAIPETTMTPSQVSMKFTVAQGGSRTLNIPVSGTPVRLSAMLTAQNGAFLSLTTAVLAEDPVSQQVTWMGTFRGGQIVGTTPTASDVGYLENGRNLIVATLTVAPAGPLANLTITQSSAATTVPLTYTVVMDN